MKVIHVLILSFLFLACAVAVQAQEECNLDVSQIISQVTQQCAAIGDNQVCYGNRDVQVTPRENAVNFVFQNPGDIVSLSNIQSLFVSEVDPTTDQWGVAQMRLQVSSGTGLQNVTMLLFGAFNIESTPEATATLDVRILTVSSDIFSSPDLTSLSLANVPNGTFLRAVGRTEDSAWLRVENGTTGITGWVPAERLTLVDSALSIGLLPVQDSNTRSYSAMQAFYFSNDNSNTGCANLASDGLLIQTPEGVARVSLLINEVSIELTGGGAGIAGTAFVQANPDSEQGMAVNVVEGSATVETSDGSSQTLNTGQQTSIPIDENLQASGAPSDPINIDLSSINIQPFLPIFNASNTASTGGGGSGGGNNNSNSNNGNGSGINLGGNSGSPSDSSNSNTTGNINVTIGGGNNTNSTLPTSLDEIERAQEQAANPQTPWFLQGNFLALAFAVIAGIIVIVVILYNTLFARKR